MTGWELNRKDKTMETLRGLTKESLAIGQAMQDEGTRHKETIERLRATLAEVETAIGQHRAGLDRNLIARAEEVLSIDGSWRRRGEDGAAAVAAAIADLATNGGRRLASEYFGVKDYDRWSGQRCDCEYGMGPRHGHIVFAIEMRREVRDRIHAGGQLSAEETEAALYYLYNIETVTTAQVAG